MVPVHEVWDIVMFWFNFGFTLSLVDFPKHVIRVVPWAKLFHFSKAASR